ncbi:hypothetical protein PYW07_016436 [Mythimna separata]|uniref:HTH psq-type domain-containing protein n=1 Tax=Mythimna separata TaxID=271217 RepID=A0AAD8DSR7_MYTSE|nr:hypothetical protein PYW07_016436 [Mythimna separata]
MTNSIYLKLMIFTGSKLTKLPLWTEQDLREAMSAVQWGTMTKKAASDYYGISIPALTHHLKTGSTVKKTGRSRILNEEQEKELVKRLLSLCTGDSRVSLTPKLVRSQAFKFCEENDVRHNFNLNKGLAGADWYNGFMNRHPELPVERRRWIKIGGNADALVSGGG